MEEILHITEEDVMNLYSAIKLIMSNKELNELNHPNIKTIFDQHYIKLRNTILLCDVTYYNMQEGATVMFLKDGMGIEYELERKNTQAKESILFVMDFILPNSSLIYQRYKNMEIILGK